jgi:type I restriction enzyme S subunit
VIQLRTIESLCSLISSGGTPSRKRPEFYTDRVDGHLWVKSKELLDRSIEGTEEKITDEGLRSSSAKYFPADTVLIAMYGANVGQLGRLKCPATVNQAVCGLVVNKEIASSRFVFYALLETREALAAKAQGAAQQNLNQGLIREFRIPSPQLPTQRKIAAILSAYDDLIENNLRRIKILEEMAQNLYREWFVKFRFPGHQHARFTDSSLGRIPEGWEVRELQEIAQVIDCLHSKKPQQIESGTRILLQLYNIGDGGKIDLSDIFLIADDDYQKWISRIEVRAGDCVITNVGRVGAVAQIPIGLKAALGRNMTAVRPVAIGPTYLIEYLLSPHMIKEVQIKKDAGSIMDSLNVKGIVKLVVPVGPRPLMDCFEETTRPMRALIERLFEKNNNLRRTRDLLLPRLISGKVDVSELEIAISEETKT